jgi:hypothetical protein
LGTTKVSASEETHSINPALASKMTGEALMTQASDRLARSTNDVLILSCLGAPA